MSVNTILYTNSAQDNSTWKKLAVNSVHAKQVHTNELFINEKLVGFDKIDITLPVNTYDSSNVLINSGVYIANFHCIRVGHIIMITVGSFSYTPSVGTIAYFGITIPSQFRTNSPNICSFLANINNVITVCKVLYESDGILKIHNGLTNTNFTNAHAVITNQQTLTFDNTN